MHKTVLMLAMMILGSTTSAQDLQKLIDNEVAAGKKKITIPAGKYRVKPQQGVHLRLENLDDVEIDATGAELICTETTRAIEINNCTNLTLRGLTVDYDPLPFIQGKITAKADDGRWFELEVVDGYRQPGKLEAKKVEIFNPETGLLRTSTYYGTKVESVGEYKYRVTQPKAKKNAGERIGDIVVLGWKHTPGKRRIPHAVFADNCKFLRFENVTLYASNCFGFLENYCEKSTFLNCVIDRRKPELDLKPRDVKRMRSLNADGYHSKFASVGPQIIGCTARFQGDDCVNICGACHLIVESNGAVLRVLDKGGSLARQLVPGLSVELLSAEGGRLPDAQIVSVKKLGTATDKDKAFVRDLKMDERLKKGLKNVFEITLNRDADLPAGSTISAMHGQHFLIKNNTFGHNRSRGIITKSRNGKIVDNRIEGCWMPAIRVGPDLWWLESGSTENLLISGNEIKNCHDVAVTIFSLGRKGEIPADCHKNISIVNNTISGSPKPGILVTSTKDLELKNNKIDLPEKSVKRYRQVRFKNPGDKVILECSAKKTSPKTEVSPTKGLSIVPAPQQVKQLETAPFELRASTEISYGTKEAKGPAELLALSLRKATGFALPVKQSSVSENQIVYRSKSDLGKEAYQLNVNSARVEIVASKSGGFIYGGNTLLQLLPAEVFKKETTKSIKWLVPAVKIKDKPEYAWRGMMLDVSRYFFTKDFILKYLDIMAMHKMNVFHWHLIDDSGWRLEIKKYPKLTTIGGFRGEGKKRYGGFYTQDEIREVVKYAADRNITIVPEIEIPAHTHPALVAYPHLGCTGEQFKPQTRQTISSEIYCAGKDTTWKFLTDVMDEVCELFPSPWIHVGGDEARYGRWEKCPHCQAKIKKEGLKDAHELQGWLTVKMEAYLAKKGKRIIGWDEVLATGVTKQTGIMQWRNNNTASKSVEADHPVVRAHNRHAYFDTPESFHKDEPRAANWIPPISLQKSYEWDLVPEGVKEEDKKYVLGVNGCVWCNILFVCTYDEKDKRPPISDQPGEGTTRSEQYVEYLSLPRMAALAEVSWTRKPLRNYEDFSARMKRMYVRYSNVNFTYRLPMPTISSKRNENGTWSVTSTIPAEGATVHYTTDGSEPNADSPQLQAGTVVKDLKKLRYRTVAADGKTMSLAHYNEVPIPEKFKNHGLLLGDWKPLEVRSKSKSSKTIEFDATGKITGNGVYEITFERTVGSTRLNLQGVEVLKDEIDPVDKDIHKGFTATRRTPAEKNVYTITVSNYETGASFTVKAKVHTRGDYSKGLVFIRKVK